MNAYVIVRSGRRAISEIFGNFLPTLNQPSRGKQVLSRLVIFGTPSEQTFPPTEARRIAKRLEFHHTPKYGSWLNMAESEFSVLARACLKGLNPSEEALQESIGAYEPERTRR